MSLNVETGYRLQAAVGRKIVRGGGARFVVPWMAKAGTTLEPGIVHTEKWHKCGRRRSRPRAGEGMDEGKRRRKCRAGVGIRRKLAFSWSCTARIAQRYDGDGSRGERALNVSRRRADMRGWSKGRSPCRPPRPLLQSRSARHQEETRASAQARTPRREKKLAADAQCCRPGQSRLRAVPR